ncbi:MULTISPECIES: PEP-CTERM sorting domain-containing protein [unclassified Anabaena]|uniref:PEP-CTERM sorting domain-containing protein n=1 Tax=unclassified Anabaena TaxID=2619674 RepID=UPI001445E826|nr:MULTISPECIES: PEP-CTERM sorting domain-containing protein [unclassified Anabaena]MTJ08095.1 PEP-CTERM sorting domain-containing protein [Anabaena sp. UHCC 0204]MTJ53175.1 PEP-CTERM sorting domain-containing protein [Anabaena sp. UHCC 0253]
MTTLSVFKRISVLAATSVIAVTVTTAKASATTFYLGNGIDLPEIKSSVSYTEDGISLLATGTQNSGASRNIYQSTLGLGVTSRNSVVTSVLSGDNQINGGVTLGETLNLTFSHTVKLLSTTFSRVGSNDSFKLLVDGNHYISANIPGGNFLDFDISKFTFTPSPTGNIFGFSVTDGNDDYLVKYVEVAKVPEPASMLGFLAFGAMGAGSMIKRKQQQKTILKA